MSSMTREPRIEGRGGVAFLLSQLGAHAAARFAQRIAELDLTPAQAGLLRAITSEPGQTQQSFAKLLGMPPSRFVLMVDALEERGIVERRRNTEDRRAYGLYLTVTGEALFADLGQAARAHEDDICRTLSTSERQTLRELLARVAAEQGLTPGVHPGYRSA
jgi:DNA-binding MarR family transcriptional regulator